MNAIMVKNLKKYYGSTKAVDGVSFEVFEGEIVALLGPNGAGKTTTVEIIEGLRKKDEGEIYYFGRKVDQIDKDVKSQIGVQLQKTAFFEHLTVYETIELFAGLYNIQAKKNDIENLINLVALQEKTKSRVKNLSGGQLQRLALAVALVNDPKILFLDEPTTGLDPQARRHVWEIIEQLKQKGKTIFLTTHYMEEAEKLADRVFIMDHGKIIASGTVQELVKSIGMDSYIEFSADNSQVLLKEIVNLRTADHDKLILPVSDVEESIHMLLNKAKQLEINIDNIVIRRPNLEDVFLNLTGHSLRD
ncbi:ABC transporter ATP-binding protein [Thermotoga profunda]|uniref:ABC transporter ATP-binding protein n=1 Tax=Thermotoga profunda TaxID=1508420 RepID=UPI000597A59D|nr:ABC transporter ATP-binding protein [Thermotoga profunda]